MRIYKGKKALKRNIRSRVEAIAVSKIVSMTTISADRVVRMLTNMADCGTIVLFEAGGIMMVKGAEVKAKAKASKGTKAAKAAKGTKEDIWATGTVVA